MKNLELSNKDIDLICKGLIHSANIYVTFTNNNAPEYPIEETNKYVEEINEIILKLKNCA